MSYRKTTLLRKVISYFASRSELEEFDRLFSINKGSSSHFALRLLERYFDSKYATTKSSNAPRKAENTGRSILIRYNGKTWFNKI